MKILLVDDNESITRSTSNLLKFDGHECITVNDGRNGLSLLEGQNFDVVMLDINMPGISGLDVIDALEKSGKIKKQKILVLTATNFSDDEITDLKRRGVYMCLRKPIDPDILVEALKN